MFNTVDCKYYEASISDCKEMFGEILCTVEIRGES